MPNHSRYYRPPLSIGIAKQVDDRERLIKYILYLESTLISGFQEPNETWTEVETSLRQEHNGIEDLLEGRHGKVY
jgi:hypothetical protein